jgi:hypothetical protein
MTSPSAETGTIESRCGSASVKRKIPPNNPGIRDCGQIAYTDKGRLPSP